MRDMRCNIGGEVYCGFRAALEIAQRQGIGKLRHVRTQAFWLQEVRGVGGLGYKKDLGAETRLMH